MKRAITGLAICSLLIFWGRAYHYYFWDSPIRVLAWDQALFGPIVEGLLGLSWEEYAADQTVDQKLSLATQICAYFFALAGLASIILLRWPKRWLAIPIFFGVLLLGFHALLEMKDHFYHLAQFFEFGIQLGTPLLLTWAVLWKPSWEQLLLGLKITVASTFVAHGLYAIGFYPVPGHFVDMTINILGVSEAVARWLLYVAGALDLVVGLALFWPPSQKAAMTYAVVWGLLTALARIVSGFDAYFPLETIHASAYATVYRLPHGLLPLVGLLLLSDLSEGGEYQEELKKIEHRV